jgi:hypothetical protein
VGAVSSLVLLGQIAPVGQFGLAFLEIRLFNQKKKNKSRGLNISFVNILFHTIPTILDDH